MKQIFKTDISQKTDFVFQDTRLIQKYYDSESGCYLYERYHINSPTLGNRLMGYEIVKPVKHKNPDGATVYVYPSSEQFGLYGWFYPPNTSMEKLTAKFKSIAEKEKNRKQKGAAI